ncbi:FAD-dependent oxidoreductase, partial [Kineococcus glutinatus]|uniref:FAD-dependent oxidoreductase n=1 Tax=Kineococcus glutinatus TaxID=1070872 RepID=UPI0031EA0251
MEPSRARYDVAVVGGGAIGWSCAWRAAQRGLSVLVCDPSPGTGASWVAAGMLAPVTELHPGEEPLLRLGLEAARRYPRFVAELTAAAGTDPGAGPGVGHRTSGTLAVALDRGDLAVLDEALDLQRSLGLAARRLTGSEVRRLEPVLTPQIGGGLLVEGDHQVDNRRLLAALRPAAARTGAEVLAERVGVRVDGGRAVGVVRPG